MKIFKNNKTGFTMIELLVVTTIIIVLTTIGLVSFTTANRNARNGKRKADLEMVRQALVLYRVDAGSYPSGTVFSTMISTISEYTSATEVTDPKNDATYFYAYSSDGSTFTLTAILEPDGTAYPLSSP